LRKPRAWARTPRWHRQRSGLGGSAGTYGHAVPLFEQTVRQSPRRLRVPKIMKHVMRWHDFGSGREAGCSQYREYGHGERQSHGPNFVPVRRVAAIIAARAAAGSRGPGFRGCDRGGAHVDRADGARYVPLRGRIHRPRPTEPAPPCAGHFVGRLGHAPRPRCGAAGCGTGRAAACSCDIAPGLPRLLPQTGLRLTSRSRLDMPCAVLRVIRNSGSQRTRASLC